MKKVFGVSTQIVGQNLRTKSRGSQISLQIKNLPMDAGDSRDEGLIPGSRRSPGEGNGNLLQYSWLQNSMDRGAWQAIVHRVTLRWIQLSMRPHTS